MSTATAVATHGPGLWLDGRACLLLWQHLRGLERLPESAAEIKNHLRLAASEWLTAQRATAGGPAGGDIHGPHDKLDT